MAGYSGKPLHQKLGLKAGQTVCLIADGDIEKYRGLLGPDLPEIKIVTEMVPGAEVIHLFTASRAQLTETLTEALSLMARDGMIWVSWPKKASKVPSDVTEDVVRELCLPMGWSM